MKQCRRRQLKKLPRFPEVKPFSELGPVASRQLRFIACCENSSRVFTRADGPQQSRVAYVRRLAGRRARTFRGGRTAL